MSRQAIAQVDNTDRNTFRYSQSLGDIPLGRRSDLIVVTETLYWQSATPKVFLALQPFIKVFEGFLKSGFAVGRFPGLQSRHSDEIFLADQYYWNVIFLNDCAEMAWRIAGLKSRTRNIEDVPLRVALNCLWVHWDPPGSRFCKQNSNVLKTHCVLFLEIRSFENMRFQARLLVSDGHSMVLQGWRDRAESHSVYKRIPNGEFM